MTKISVVIPSFQGRPWIGGALESLSLQSLERSRFEVIVVVNGEDDGTADFSRRFLSDCGISFKVVEEEFASLAHARNVGGEAASGDYVTCLDVDDWFSNNYLEVVADTIESVSTGEERLFVAGITDVDEQTGGQKPSSYNRAMRDTAAGPVAPRSIWPVLGVAGAKIWPTSLARRYKFDTSLVNGEDVAYFAPMVAREGLTLDATPYLEGAQYFRLVREGSLGRQDLSWKFAVQDRIGVMRHLDNAIADSSADMQAVLKSLMNSQATFSRRFLDQHPDEYARVVEALLGAKLTHTPLRAVSPNTDRLAIAHNFPPFNDASGIVSAKRLVASGRPWNVVSRDLSPTRTIDSDVRLLGDAAASRQLVVSGPAYFASWPAIESFCNDGLKLIRTLEDEVGPQTKLYSRAQWPASHFLAALHKMGSSAEVHWVAEFSDPLDRDVEGSRRFGVIEPGKLAQRFKRECEIRGFPVLDESDGLFSWAEKIPYVLADELIFTNWNQLAYMSSYVDNPALRSHLISKARVSEHPTLSPQWYQARQAPNDTEQSKVNIGYFGAFYAQRGLATFAAALTSMRPVEREKFLIHVFSPESTKEAEQIAAIEETKGLFRFHEPLPYLHALAAMRTMDALLVTDVATDIVGQVVNPYLPSKLSDYRGAGVDIMALYEPGSALSQFGASYRAPVDDVREIKRVLRSLTERLNK